MQAIAYKNGGLTGNWCALMLCICNSDYSSDKALAKFGISYTKRNNKPVSLAYRRGPELNPQAIRQDYENGMKLSEIYKKYNTSYVKAKQAIEEAGGVLRKRGGKVDGQKKDRAFISY